MAHAPTKSLAKELKALHKSAYTGTNILASCDEPVSQEKTFCGFVFRGDYVSWPPAKLTTVGDFLDVFGNEGWASGTDILACVGLLGHLAQLHKVIRFRLILVYWWLAELNKLCHSKNIRVCKVRWKLAMAKSYLVPEPIVTLMRDVIMAVRDAPVYALDLQADALDAICFVTRKNGDILLRALYSNFEFMDVVSAAGHLHLVGWVFCSDGSPPCADFGRGCIAVTSLSLGPPVPEYLRHKVRRRVPGDYIILKSYEIGKYCSSELSERSTSFEMAGQIGLLTSDWVVKQRFWCTDFPGIDHEKKLTVVHYTDNTGAEHATNKGKAKRSYFGMSAVLMDLIRDLGITFLVRYLAGKRIPADLPSRPFKPGWEERYRRSLVALGFPNGGYVQERLSPRWELQLVRACKIQAEYSSPPFLPFY